MNRSDYVYMLLDLRRVSISGSVYRVVVEIQLSHQGFRGRHDAEAFHAGLNELIYLGLLATESTHTRTQEMKTLRG